MTDDAGQERTAGSADTIVAYPWFLNKPLEITVNDLHVATKITVHEWTEHLRPLLEHIYHLHKQHPDRLMIAIGGPPGTGKSVLAEQIAWMMENGFVPECHAIALSMDGFHYPNAYLTEHEETLPDGTRVPMSEVKGSPATFDLDSLRQHVKLLRACVEEMYWPGYSRVTHDVVAQKYRIHRSCNVVIVEGNYMLLDRGPFTGLPGLFDFRMYVDLPGAGIISNLMQRHMAGGKTLERAKEWVKRIDLPNARIAESTRHNADVIVERNTVDDIIDLHWQGASKRANGKSAAMPPQASVPAAAIPALQTPMAGNPTAGVPHPPLPRPTGTSEPS